MRIDMHVGGNFYQSLHCTDSGFRWRHQQKMAALISRTRRPSLFMSVVYTKYSIGLALYLLVLTNLWCKQERRLLQCWSAGFIDICVHQCHCYFASMKSVLCSWLLSILLTPRVALHIWYYLTEYSRSFLSVINLNVKSEQIYVIHIVKIRNSLFENGSAHNWRKFFLKVWSKIQVSPSKAKLSLMDFFWGVDYISCGWPKSNRAVWKFSSDTAVREISLLIKMNHSDAFWHHLINVLNFTFSSWTKMPKWDAPWKEYFGKFTYLLSDWVVHKINISDNSVH